MTGRYLWPIAVGLAVGVLAAVILTSCAALRADRVNGDPSTATCQVLPRHVPAGRHLVRCGPPRLCGAGRPELDGRPAAFCWEVGEDVCCRWEWAGECPSGPACRQECDQEVVVCTP